MNVRRWASDNYDAESAYRRAVASWLVVTVEWSISAAVALVPLMVLYAALDGRFVEWSIQTWTLVWVALTAVALLGVSRYTRRRLFGMDGVSTDAGQ